MYNVSVYVFTVAPVSSPCPPYWSFVKARLESLLLVERFSKQV